jgi:hypothetical protein
MVKNLQFSSARLQQRAERKPVATLTDRCVRQTSFRNRRAAPSTRPTCLKQVHSLRIQGSSPMCGAMRCIAKFNPHTARGAPCSRVRAITCNYGASNFTERQKRYLPVSSGPAKL